MIRKCMIIENPKNPWWGFHISRLKKLLGLILDFGFLNQKSMNKKQAPNSFKEKKDLIST